MASLIRGSPGYCLLRLVDRESLRHVLLTAGCSIQPVRVVANCLCEIQNFGYSYFNPGAGRLTQELMLCWRQGCGVNRDGRFGVERSLCELGVVFTL